MMPLESHDSKDSLTKKLIERGSQVEKLVGSHYRAYNGIGWRLNERTTQIDRHPVKSRIVLDTQGWNRYNPNQSVFVDPL